MAADEAGAAGYKYFKDGGFLLWFTSSGTKSATGTNISSHFFHAWLSQTKIY
jgi:hypothetical protein